MALTTVNAPSPSIGNTTANGDHNNISTTNNITIINCVRDRLVPLTQEMMSLSSKRMTLRHLIGGGETMANLALATTLEGNWRMAVTDLARKKSMFKDEDEELIEDLKAREFMRLWCSANLEKAERLHKNKRKELEPNPTLDLEEIDTKMDDEYGGWNLKHMRGVANGTSTDNKFSKTFCKTVLEKKAIPGLRAQLNRAFQELPIEIADEEDEEDGEDHGKEDEELIPID
jgi:hypothetical protein